MLDENNVSFHAIPTPMHAKWKDSHTVWALGFNQLQM